MLDTSLSFEKHINEKIIKAKKTLGVIKHLSRFLPLKTLCQMYKALVRSHMDYCDIIYHIPPKDTQFGLVLNALMEKVERIQYQAALTITGAWQGSNRSKLYEELGWESLSSRRWFRRILHIHKIVSNKTPCYLKDTILPYRRPLHRQNQCPTKSFTACGRSFFCMQKSTEAQPGILRVGEVLLKRGHIHIVSSGGATMVGAEEFFLKFGPARLP